MPLDMPTSRYRKLLVRASVRFLFARTHITKRRGKIRVEAGLSYRGAGVDVDAGNELVRRIKQLNADIGGFNGLFPFGDHYLVGGTDGVGTKLKVAQELNVHDTIGIDLVAMCVNDIIVCGARPLFFLDYYATGTLNIDVAESVVKGIHAGCEACGAQLMGGETAEMPGMYTCGEYDLAGFAVGSVKQSDVIRGDAVRIGDTLVALPSSGVHSNGFSLVRKVLTVSGTKLTDSVPWAPQVSFGDALLTPTTIYVNDVLGAMAAVPVHAAAHITGGGFTENLPRVVPEGCACEIDLSKWETPPIFDWLQTAGGIAEAEMLRTFNMGVGFVLVVDAGDVSVLRDHLPQAFVVGHVVQGAGVHYVRK